MLTSCLSLYREVAQGVWLWFGLFLPDADTVAFLLGGQCGDQVVSVGIQYSAKRGKPLCLAHWVIHPLYKAGCQLLL